VLDASENLNLKIIDRNFGIATLTTEIANFNPGNIQFKKPLIVEENTTIQGNVYGDETAANHEIVGFTGITFGTSAFGANPRINSNGQGNG